MRAVIRKSSLPNIANAIAEATKNLTDVKAIIILTDCMRFTEAAKLIAEKYPSVKIIGSSGMSYCNGRIEVSSLVLTVFFDDVEIIADLIPNLSKSPASSIMSIAKNAEEIRPGVDNTVCIEFCTGNEEILISTFKTGFKLNHNYLENTVKLIGGTVYVPRKDLKPLVTLNGKIYEDACVYFLIKNLRGKIHVYKENIYRPFTHIIHKVTKIDKIHPHHLVEIDGKPAADVYLTKRESTKTR